MSHHRAPHKLVDDERSQQRQEAHGRPDRRSRFRNRTPLIPLASPVPQRSLTHVSLDPHHDRPKPHTDRC